MTQQEIKENLPQLPLQTEDNDGTVLDNHGKLIVSTCTHDYEGMTDVAMDFAIVHAINNTYDKGINPESVSEMYNALQSIHQHFSGTNSNDMADIIQDILNKATL